MAPSNIDHPKEKQPLVSLTNFGDFELSSGRLCMFFHVFGNVFLQMFLFFRFIGKLHAMFS